MTGPLIPPTPATEQAPPVVPPNATVAGATPPADPPVTKDPAPDGADDLGDAGKKALTALRTERDEVKTELRSTRTELEALRQQVAQQGKPAEEVALDNARAEARAEATKAANIRVVKAEIRAAAAKSFADPADALVHLDLSKFDVSDDGEVDSSAITEAISELLKRKPYLAATGAGPVVPPAGIGQGVRQLSAPDIDTQIAEAHKAGNYGLAISLKRQKAAEAAKS